MNGPFLQRGGSKALLFCQGVGSKEYFNILTTLKTFKNISHLEKADNNILVQRSCDGAKNETDLTGIRNLFVT